MQEASSSSDRLEPALRSVTTGRPLGATALRCALALASLSAAGCRARPTQVTLLLDSNVSSDRPMSLSVVSLEGARSIDELRAALRAAPRLSNAERALFPGSAAVVPREGRPRAGSHSVLAVLDVPEQPGRPAMHIERWQRVTLIERLPQQGRIFFDNGCASRATDCTQTPSAGCTVSQRCIEQGLTCGDDGRCGSVELPLVPVPPDLPLDATVPRDAAPIDARVGDAAVCSTGFHAVGSACVANGGVRPIAPISLGDTTLRRPTLRFALPAGADGAVIELCRDRACSTIYETVRVAANTARPSVPLPGSSVVFWRARASARGVEDVGTHNGPTWLFHTPARDNSNGVDSSFNPHTDVNGDGFDDVVVGAPNAAPAGRMLAGSVSVFHGGAGGVSASAARTLEGAAASDAFGSAVATAGDVNGDGFADLIVGARSASPAGRTTAGEARVFHGSSAGIEATAARTLEGVAAFDNFGSSAASAGDVNGDGFADIIVGAPNASPGGRMRVGTVTVYYGDSAGITVSARILEGPATLAFFANSLAGAGDVNGDGFSDFVVGVYQAGPGGRMNAGAASVFHGGVDGISSSAAVSLEGASANGEFGWAVASAGDVNGDGFADIVVGARTASPGGRGGAGIASVFQGSRAGIDPTAIRSLEGAATSDVFGTSVASAGDVNGDGFADIVVGAPNASPGGRANVGAASIFHGSAAGITLSAARVLEGLATMDRFGWSAALAGDVNGDGFADVVVGARTASPGGRSGAGSAAVFHGSNAGIGATAARLLEGAAAQDSFGQSVASDARAALSGHLRCARSAR